MSRYVEHLFLKALPASHIPAHLGSGLYSLSKAVGYFNTSLPIPCSIPLSQTCDLHLSQRFAESFQVCAIWFPHKFPFSSLIVSFYFINVCMYVCMARRECGGQRTICGDLFFPSTTWVLGVEHRSSGLAKDESFCPASLTSFLPWLFRHRCFLRVIVSDATTWVLNLHQNCTEFAN